MTNIKNLGGDNGVTWFEISGTDRGTDWEFEGVETYGVTDDDRILDCDGCPIKETDRLTIAVRNSLSK